MTVGEKIRAFREHRGWTQKQLGDACGIIEGSIRKYELGLRNPKAEQLKKIAAGLQVSESVFYDFDIATVSDVVALLFMLDNATEIELNKKGKDVYLKFNDEFLKKFMREWYTAKTKTSEIKAEVENITNNEAKTAVIDKADEYYNKFKTAALDNPAIIKKDTDGITIRNYGAILDEN